MNRNQGRRMTAEEKLGVVEEGRQSGAARSEVCRRHQIHHTQFYRWERLARQGALEALSGNRILVCSTFPGVSQFKAKARCWY